MKPNTLKKETIKYLNERLADEYKAHYFYMGAHQFCQNAGYFKAAKFFLEESNTELEHAKGLIEYANKWNVYLTLPSIEAPEKCKGLVEIIEEGYTIEYELLVAYNKDSMDCFDIDLNTFDFLQKYRTIQMESVAEYSDMLNILELFDKTDANWIFNFEKKLFHK